MSGAQIALRVAAATGPAGLLLAGRAPTPPGLSPVVALAGPALLAAAFALVRPRAFRRARAALRMIVAGILVLAAYAWGYSTYTFSLPGDEEVRLAGVWRSVEAADIEEPSNAELLMDFGGSGAIDLVWPPGSRRMAGFGLLITFCGGLFVVSLGTARLAAGGAGQMSDGDPDPEPGATGPPSTRWVRTDGEAVRLESVVESDGEGTAADIVFVHGLGGNGYSTWTADPDDFAHFWPAWLADDVERVTVSSLFYPARLTQWTSKARGKAMPLETRAENLLAFLHARGIGDRPTVFVAHSLGGLMVKEMLRSSATGGVADHERLARNTRGVVFLATPHQGSDFASLGRALGATRYGRFVRFSPHIMDLRRNSPQLRQLFKWYSNNARSMGFATLAMYEHYPVAGPLPVVDAASANPGVEGAIVTGADADHFTIVKPRSRESPTYLSVRTFVQDTLATP